MKHEGLTLTWFWCQRSRRNAKDFLLYFWGHLMLFFSDLLDIWTFLKLMYLYLRKFRQKILRNYNRQYASQRFSPSFTVNTLGSQDIFPPWEENRSHYLHVNEGHSLRYFEAFLSSTFPAHIKDYNVCAVLNQYKSLVWNAQSPCLLNACAYGCITPFKGL